MGFTDFLNSFVDIAYQRAGQQVAPRIDKCSENDLCRLVYTDETSPYIKDKAIQALMDKYRYTDSDIQKLL